MTVVTLGVDLGSHGARAVLVRDGKVIAHAGADYAAPPPARHTGRELWQVFVDCVRSLPAGPRREVTGIGITGVRGAVVGLAADGFPATPVFPDFDEAAVAPARALAERFGKAFLAHTGCPPFPLAGLPKMMLPVAGATVRWWLSPQDYAAFRCTAKISLSAGSGLRLGLLEATGTAVDREIVESAGIDPSTIPPVLPVGSTIGNLTAEASAELQLPRNVPVVACPGDVPAGFLAAGARPGLAFANLGTTTVVCCLANDHGPSEGLTHEILDRDRRSFETGVGAGGITFDWLSRLFAVPHKTLEAEAEAAHASAIVVQPEMLSPWGADVAAAISGVRATDGRAEIVRAAYSAVACILIETLEELQGATGPLTTLALGGGGAASDLLCREIASVWKGSLQRLSGRELAAEGAATVAAGATVDVRIVQSVAQ